jgi:hypothetical protein
MRVMLRYLARGVAGLILWASSSCAPRVRLFESDLLGKYVERLLQERGQLPKPTISIDTDYLQKRGLI